MSDDHTRRWSLSRDHLSPHEVAAIREDARDGRESLFLSDHNGCIVAAVPKQADRELPLRHPYLAAGLAEARRRGFQLVSFDADGERVATLPVHDGGGADSARQTPAARRRLWLVRVVASGLEIDKWHIRRGESALDLRGYEGPYAALHDEIARTADEPKVLLVEPRQDEAHPARLTLHPSLDAAALDRTQSGNDIPQDQWCVVDLETFLRTRAVLGGAWESEAIWVPMLCRCCGDPYGHATASYITDELGKDDAPVTCRDCLRPGTWSELIPVYEWEPVRPSLYRA